MPQENQFMPEENRELLETVAHIDARSAAEIISEQDDAVAVDILQQLNPSAAQDILDDLEPEHRSRLLAAAPHAAGDQWTRNLAYEDGTIGHMMEAPTVSFPPATTVGEAIAVVREIARRAMVTYAFVVESGRLVGVITMRDLLLSDRSTPLSEVMLRDVFFLSPAMTLPDAMKLVLNRHYPLYPVCDEQQRLVGQIRGEAMFEEQAFEISAQPGRMVGVDKEERLATHWLRSLKFRHPWLQLNLVTAFVAAAVVGFFQETIDRLVILAMFLPVLAGQSGNTGCQALAVALRGLTLGELAPGRERALVRKEALLGLLNGALVGVSAGVGMFIVARMQHHPEALMLGTIVFTAMVGSCVISGVAGAVIPLLLRRVGADPATASSIFLTTATDVASMGIFLGLASLLIR